MRHSLQLGFLTITFIGLFAAGVLAVGHVLNLPVPCGASRGCMVVAMHPSSKLLGIPIAFFGLAAYCLCLYLLHETHWLWARRSLLALTLCGTLISAGLLFYARSVIGATCAWCVVSGTAFTSLFLLSIPLVRFCRAPFPLLPRFTWALGLLTACGIGLQAGLMQRESLRPPIAAEKLANLDRAELALVGNSLGPINAPVTVVLFGDLWCHACRVAYGSLVRYQAANPTAVRIVYRHLPLWEIRGHEFSGTAAGLSEIAAEQGKFWTFAGIIHQQHHQLSSAGYLKILSTLGISTNVVESRLANLEDPAVARVQRDMDLADRLGVQATPTFIVMIPGQPPVSANPRTLPRLLQSPPVLAELLRSTRSPDVPIGNAHHAHAAAVSSAR